MIEIPKITIFEGKKIRRKWDEEREKWYFSVVNIVAVLTNQIDFIRARKYWNKLAERLREEESIQASDGKFYKTNVADVETLLRLIQSAPSPKAEPIKLWLARVGFERIQETNDPELVIKRITMLYKINGFLDDWIKFLQLNVNVCHPREDGDPVYNHLYV